MTVFHLRKKIEKINETDIDKMTTFSKFIQQLTKN